MTTALAPVTGCSMEQTVKKQPEQRINTINSIKQALPMWAYVALFIAFLIALMIIDVKYNIGITKVFTAWY